MLTIRRIAPTNSLIAAVSTIACLLPIPISVFGQPTSVGSSAAVKGLREKPPAVHALINAKIVASPTEQIDSGVIIIRDGLIEFAGNERDLPADARIWDLQGKTVYPGFVDAYGEYEIKQASSDGTAHWNPHVRPHWRTVDHYKPDQSANKALREQGFVAKLLSPKGGIVRGVSSLVSTGDAPAANSIVVDVAAMHMRLTVSRGGGRDQYPNSPMGAVALARQTMYDAQWYRNAWNSFNTQTGVPRPEENLALESLQSARDGQLVMTDASDEHYALRADRFAREFALNVAMRGSGHEYRRLDAIAATGRPFVLPLTFPKPPNVQTPENAMRATLDEMLHWDLAPENPARLRNAGVTIALTTQGLKKSSEFLPALRKAVKRGLSKEDALAALTMAPAELFGVANRMGTISAKKHAHLVITDGDLFETKTKVLETWIDGKRFVHESQPRHDILGTWQVSIGAGDDTKQLSMEITGKPDKLQGKVASKEEPKDESQEQKAEAGNGKDQKVVGLRLAQSRLHFSVDGAALESEGKFLFSVNVAKDEAGNLTWQGNVRDFEGVLRPVAATRVDKAVPQEDANDDEEEEDKDKAEKETKPASFPVRYPLTAFGRDTIPAQQTVAFTGATVWTCDQQGVLEDATVLIADGKIVAVGANVEIPPDAIRVGASRMHISPGIIDCHSHMATDGGINEATQAVTAEVRIGDFIDSRDINIYRQLAGGVTTSNILHGSANPIGGQNQVIKLRWGQLPEAMKFADAPLGIKFALGENVKQSNWGDDHRTRYPQSRMGVPQLVRDSFQAALEYKRRQASWAAERRGLPVRRDLELDALLEIIEGRRWIHCHSYRQDEIVALLRVLEEFGIQIGTLQHILEGYKVADVMKNHGAMGSSFADWWSYKYEVIDAIPYNGTLMHNVGIVVSFNSDDAELARHLNQEAAKAVKYGGLDPAEALKFVTLNPAKQLRIDQHVGSITPGKHADLVLWSAPPLSNYARCQQTWVDGRRYFDREADAKARKTAAEMKNVLVQKILDSGEGMLKPGESNIDAPELWPREDLFCGRHGHDHQHTSGGGHQ